MTRAQGSSTRWHRSAWHLLATGTTLLGVTLSGSQSPAPAPTTGASHESARFSPLADLTPANVTSLAPAWTYHTRDFSGGLGPTPARSVPGVQTSPLLSGDTLYVTTPSSIVIALDPETGRERWRHDPQAGKPRRCYEPHRGVSIWQGSDRAQTVRTVFSGTCDGRLIALDATTGKPRGTFGTAGGIDLRAGVDARDGDAYSMTTPPAIFRDLVIAGAQAPEGTPRGPAGDVRAFDVRTGRQVWRFHTVPRPGEVGHDTWPADGWQRRTGVNVWSAMSVDHDRGLLFLPIGSPSYDFYGADRAGQNLFGNSLVALDATTGVRKWHAQLVHHDIWDFDPPAQPILADIRRDGRVIPVVVQVTKMGLVFVFDRTNGTPVFGIEERPVPQSVVPGERTWPTQPFPTLPRPLARHTPLTRDQLTTVTPESRAECERLFDLVTSGGLFTPPGLTPTLWFPGTMGGATWSGGAVDPSSSLLIVNTNEVGAVGQMAPTPAGSALAYTRTGPAGPYGRFWDSRQLPCQQPPWGVLHAVDLSTGHIAWQVPLGNVPVLEAQGITGTGSPNIGGAIVTGGGLVFIGGASDSRLRAFELHTGKEVWRADLPASGHALPITYRGPTTGRQYVVIAAGGGGKFSRTISDAIVAFARP
ncbi:MAG: pyrroloquinoline quinone-dependent dehydrogenase [Acidobacteria bacterium]|nr:pyrroloquinoline quinone-dependent dehydrogenase [Acidobacteriota bacterium]